MKDVITIAKEAGLTIRGHYDESGSTPQELERFAALVREDAIDKFNRQINQACEEARLLDDGEKQQEPVAWVDKDNLIWRVDTHMDTTKMRPLYTTPPTAALAARQMRDAAVKVCRRGLYSHSDFYADLIAALPVPEVQWRDLTDDEIDWLICTAFHGDLKRLVHAVIAKFKEKQL